MIHQDESAVAPERSANTHTPRPETKSYNDITEQRRSLSKGKIRTKEREKKSVLLPLNGNLMHGLTS